MKKLLTIALSVLLAFSGFKTYAEEAYGNLGLTDVAVENIKEPRATTLPFKEGWEVVGIEDIDIYMYQGTDAETIEYHTFERQQMLYIKDMFQSAVDVVMPVSDIDEIKNAGSGDWWLRVDVMGIAAIDYSVEGQYTLDVRLTIKTSTGDFYQDQSQKVKINIIDSEAPTIDEEPMVITQKEAKDNVHTHVIGDQFDIQSFYASAVDQNGSDMLHTARGLFFVTAEVFTNWVNGGTIAEEDYLDPNKVKETGLYVMFVAFGGIDFDLQYPNARNYSIISGLDAFVVEFVNRAPVDPGTPVDPEEPGTPVDPGTPEEPETPTEKKDDSPTLPATGLSENNMMGIAASTMFVGAGLVVVSLLKRRNA